MARLRTLTAYCSAAACLPVGATTSRLMVILRAREVQRLNEEAHKDMPKQLAVWQMLQIRQSPRHACAAAPMQ